MKIFFILSSEKLFDDEKSFFKNCKNLKKILSFFLIKTE